MTTQNQRNEAKTYIYTNQELKELTPHDLITYYTTTTLPLQTQHLCEKIIHQYFFSISKIYQIPDFKTKITPSLITLAIPKTYHNKNTPANLLKHLNLTFTETYDTSTNTYYYTYKPEDPQC